MKFKTEYLHYNAEEEIVNNFPPVIYKYRDWENSYHREILTKQEIFFPAPKELNDPYDCNLSYRYDLMNKEEKVAFAIRTLSTCEPSNRSSIRKKARQLANSPHMKDPKYLKQAGEVQLARIRKSAGIFCASKDPKSNLMWAYYADSHKGFCIGFNTLDLFYDTKASLGDVEYPKEFPVLKPSIDRSYDVYRQLHTKSFEWYHEKEIRLSLYHTQKRTFKIRKTTIDSVVMGMRMTEEHKLQLVQVLQSTNTDQHKIQLYKIQQAVDSYDLEMNNVNY